jgi:ketosteroid isomerase-like protein
MSRDEEAITRMFNDYGETFQALEPRSAASYCDVPCMIITPQGARVMTHAAEVESLFAAMMSALKSRGYARSEITEMRVSQMSDHTALVSVNRVRYRADGRELERLGETYTLSKVDGGWKIAVAVVHDPDAILALAGARAQQDESGATQQQRRVKAT